MHWILSAVYMFTTHLTYIEKVRYCFYPTNVWRTFPTICKMCCMNVWTKNDLSTEVKDVNIYVYDFSAISHFCAFLIGLHVLLQRYLSTQRTHYIRPFPSCSKPLFQSKATSKAIDMNKWFSYSHVNIIHYHKKGFTLSLSLRVFWNSKMAHSIVRLKGQYCQHYPTYKGG